MDDNAFTNELARWNIARALGAVDLYQRVGPTKPARFDRSWHLATKILRTGATDGASCWPRSYDRHHEQFAGFHALEGEPMEMRIAATTRN